MFELACDEEGLYLMHHAKLGEVQVATVHDLERVERSGFWHQNVEHIDIVQLAVGDEDEGWDAAAQVEQRMDPYRRFGRAERGPQKHRQARVDRRRIERVGRVLQLETKAVAKVELSSLRDQVLGECRMNAPISRFVRVGQCRALDLLAEPNVAKLGRLCRQADLDVAQTLAVSQVRKRHHAELLGAGHRLDVPVAVVAIDDAMKGLPGQKAMIWANKVLLRFIGVSGENEAQRLPHRRFAVQIGDTKKSSECRSGSRFQAPRHRFSRTLLSLPG